MSRDADNARLVRRLQRAAGLKPDGWAGARTEAALSDLLAAAGKAAIPAGIDRFTVDLVAAMFPATTPRANIAAHLPLVLEALRADGLTSDAMVLMALATIRAETESFAPIDEGVSRYNTDPGGKPFGRYDHRADLGNAGPGDGAAYRGRGFVQLTGRANYAAAGKRLGLDLVAHPELASQPDVSARILADYLRERRQPIEAALADRDFRLARRLVNGGSHGLDRFRGTYLSGESLIG